MSSSGEQRVQSTISVARFLLCQAHQLFTQLRIVIRCWFVAITAAIEIHKLAGLALTHPKLLNGKRYIGSHTGKPQPFFRTIAFGTSLSRLRSATRCFKRRFSSSRLFSRCASLTSRPPYLLFQV
jgi:hypothetical protein